MSSNVEVIGMPAMRLVTVEAYNELVAFVEMLEKRIKVLEQKLEAKEKDE